jgi:hypothetical protein
VSDEPHARDGWGAEEQHAATGTVAGADRFAAWIEALQARHLGQLRPAEVSRALRALSAAYVQGRASLAYRAALSGGGKRAAFALVYGPLHFLAIAEILRRLAAPQPRLDTIADLGCGTGAGGAAWALAQGGRPRLVGIDRHHWAVTEAAWTYRQFGLRGGARQADVTRVALPSRRSGILAAWLVNELDEDRRSALLSKLVAAHARGATLLVVEPIARAAAPWWAEWAGEIAALGGSADEWRFRTALPEAVTRLGRAAGLSLQEITARSLFLAGREGRARPRLHAAVAPRAGGILARR